MSSGLSSESASTLARWHEMLSSGDLADLESLLHPSATFRSPMAFIPYHSASAAALIIRTVFGVLRHFTYHRVFHSADGQSVTLEFSAEVAGLEVKGVDLIQFDRHGRIIDFEVMVRPLNGLVAIGEAMGKRLSGQLAAYRPPAPAP